MDINVTILIQLGLFLFVLVTASGLLIRPFLRIIEERHQKTQGLKDEIDRLARLAEENQTAYVARVREARNVARQEREALRAQGNDEKRKLLAQVRSDIAQALNDTRDRIARSEGEAGVALARERDQLAKLLVAKVLGREVSQ
jgi:F0F1-type ATP synthase membrane subunit b/b'